MSSKQNVQALVLSKLKSYERMFYQEDLDAILASGLAAIPPLMDALQDPELRRPALELLCQFGTKARTAVSLAIEILGSERDEDTAWRAIELLVAIGRPALGPLLERIGRASEVEFPRVRRALQDFNANDVNPGLIKRLKDHDPLVRARCCKILASIGSSKMYDPTKALIECLSDADESVRNAAIKTLRASSSAQEILDAFEKGETATRVACMQVLSESWSFVDLPFFVTSLTDSDPLVRIHAASGLMRSAIHTSEYALREESRNQQSEVRFAALKVCRTSANQSFNLDEMAFRSLCDDDDQQVAREAIALAVENRQYRKSYLRCERTRVAFAKAILDDSDPNRCRYFYALTHADAFGKSLIPTVIACLQEPRSDVVIAAIHALGEIGEGCEEVVNALIPFLDTSVLSYRVEALYALQRIGPASKLALPGLRELLNNNNLKTPVLLAMESMGPAAEPAMLDVAALIGQRIEHPPFVLASIGTREAIIELAKAKASYGRGDRKDFDASCGALYLIAESARPVLEAELKSAKAEDCFWILDGLESVLDRPDFYDVLMTEHLHGIAERQLTALRFLLHVLSYNEQLLSKFVKTAEAINRLARALRSDDRVHRMSSLELFCLIKANWSEVVKVYVGQLAKCIGLTLADAQSEYEVEQLHIIAAKLGLPPV